MATLRMNTRPDKRPTPATETTFFRAWWRHYLLISLFALWPVVSFAAANLTEDLHIVPLTAVFGVNLTMAVVGFHVLKLFFRSSRPERCAAAAAVGISALYLLHVVKIPLISAGFYSHVNLIVAWTIVFAALTVGAWVIFSSPRALGVLISVGAVMVLMAGAPVVHYAWSKAGQAEEAPESSSMAAAGPQAQDRPNVYYILVDAYVRADELLKNTGYDNGPFLGWLAEKGFNTLAKARTNYFRTHYSVPSTLSMNYLFLPSERRVRDEDEIWSIMKGRNRVIRKFRSLGYSYIYAGGRAWCTEVVDRCIAGTGFLRGETWRLIHNSPIPGVIFYLSGSLYTRLFAAHRGLDVDDVTAAIPSLRRRPRFVFYHEMAVHDSIYNSDCTYRRELAEEEALRVDNDARMLGSRSAYVATVECVNRKLKSLLSAILAEDGQAIIVLTADHGSAFNNADGAEGDDLLSNPAYLRERAAVLSSWRLPRRCRGLVYEGLSNVNHFKVLFACLTGEKPDLLPDKTFAHDPGRFGVVVWVPEDVFAGQ